MIEISNCIFEEKEQISDLKLKLVNSEILVVDQHANITNPFNKACTIW